MGMLQPVLILALLGSALPHAGALAIDPPPRVGAVKDASRSEPRQPQPKADTLASEKEQQKENDKDKEKDKDTDKEKAASADEPKPDPKPDAKGHRVKPVEPPATRKPPLKRRATAAQLDDGMNPPVYRPRLEPVAPMPTQPTPSAMPPGPVILNGCPGAHCTDRSGQRYNPVGTTLISPQGRLCNHNGISVSCY